MLSYIFKADHKTVKNIILTERNYLLLILKNENDIKPVKTHNKKSFWSVTVFEGTDQKTLFCFKNNLDKKLIKII